MLLSKRDTSPRSEPRRRSARDAALDLLSRRSHSAAELGLKLKRRGYDQSDVVEAVAWLRSLGYVDDASFAAALARVRSESRGRRLIAAELMSKGVDRDVAAAALGKLEPAAEEEAVVRMVQREAARLGDPCVARRLRNRLLRRGFSWDTIERALRAAHCQEVSAV